MKEIDSLVGSRRRSSFLTEAAEERITSLRQLAALDVIKGAWKDSDHPELKHGSVKWVKKLRQETDRCFKKLTTH